MKKLLIGITLLLSAGIAGAQELNVTRSRTYVENYVVQDGIAVPLTNVYTEGFYFGPYRRTRRQTVRPPLRLSTSERDDVAQFLRETLPTKYRRR